MWLPMRVSMKPHGYVGGLYLPMWGHMAVWCGVWPFVLLKTWTSLLKVVLRLVHGCVTTPVSFWWLKISLKLPQIGTHAHVDILSSFGYLCGLQMSSKIAPQHHLCPFFSSKMTFTHRSCTKEYNAHNMSTYIWSNPWSIYIKYYSKTWINKHLSNPPTLKRLIVLKQISYYTQGANYSIWS